MLCLLLIFFFFFKQKTAYEMRISDWSSDVCSSDLRPGPGRRRSDRRDAGASDPDQPTDRGDPARRAPVPSGGQRARTAARERLSRTLCLIALAWRVHPRFPLALIATSDAAHTRPRSEELRVGKECGRPGSSGWWPV